MSSVSVAASPWRRQVELAALVGQDRRAKELFRGARDDVLEDRHHVGVVGVGLVQLQHRELRVVTRRQPFVAEYPPDLIDALSPPTTHRFR